MEKTTILRRVLGDFRKTGSERLFHCPNCKHSKNKLSINIDKDKFQCWHCNYGGRSVYRLIRRFGSFTNQQAWLELSSNVDLALFDELFSEDKKENHVQVVDLPEEYIKTQRQAKTLSSTSFTLTSNNTLCWSREYLTQSLQEKMLSPS